MTQGNTPCGIGIPADLFDPTNSMDLIRAFVTRAEDLDFDSLWVSESILGRASVLEPVSLLSYVAALTQRVRLGVAVILLTLRNPVQLAKSLSSLDRMSDGRLDVGLGIGGHIPEEKFGYSSQGRIGRFEEAIAVMKTLWTEPQAEFAGAYWNFADVSLKPEPLQKPHPPLWFGARVPAALRRAVKFGDGWMGAGSSTIEDFVTQYGQIQQFLAEADRDPATFKISKRVYLAVDDNKSEAEARLQQWFGARYGRPAMAPRVSIWGSQQECLDKLGVLVQTGAQHLLLEPVYDELEQLEILAEDIVPRL